MTTYETIAYPNGIRTVVATLHDVKVPEGAVIRATVQAKARGEYVDAVRDGVIIATCDGAGPISGDEGDFRPGVGV